MEQVFFLTIIKSMFSFISCLYADVYFSLFRQRKETIVSTPKDSSSLNEAYTVVENLLPHNLLLFLLFLCLYIKMDPFLRKMHEELCLCSKNKSLVT